MFEKYKADPSKVRVEHEISAERAATNPEMNANRMTKAQNVEELKKMSPDGNCVKQIK